MFMSLDNLVPWSWTRRKPVNTASGGQILPLQRQINDVFDKFFTGSFFEPFGAVFEGTEGAFVPKVDVKETDKSIVVKAELPGLTQENVKLTLTDDSLILRGEKREEHEEKDEKNVRYYAERRYGSFQRVIPLNVEVDDDKVDAAFKNGVLTITLPKTVQSQKGVKEVSIRAG
jgi:HSP20 family protein